MSQHRLLKEVCKILNKENIEYMLTGSIVSSIQGEPRSTHDIDIVVNLLSQQIEPLAENFKNERFYLHKPSMYDAVNRKGMFNLIDHETGYKVDFWLLKELPFDLSSFKRKVVTEIEGITTFFTTPEDTIVQKLRWAQKTGGSDVQIRDVIGVYSLWKHKLDLPYIEYWINELKLQEYWQQILERAS